MILGFKGFKPGLVATLGNGKFQYVPNELNETKKAMCASTGFHYCLDPWDCLNWYTWNGKNEFWAVAAGGDVDEDGYGSRSSCTKLVPLRKLTAEEFLLIIGVLSSGNNIPIYTLQNGAAGKADWASKTADEIAADIAGILNYIDTLTQNVEHPDSWVMPNDLYTSLNLRRIDGTGESVLSYIKDHTPQIKNWEVAGELSKGNKDYNSTGKNIGLLYTKDSDKMSHEVPMAFLQHAPQDRNLEIVINCEGRDAGMMIPYPLSACLVYGL